MADWLQCNRCSIVPSSNVKFFLTECGHIFCHKCVEKIKETGKCGFCSKETSVLALGKDVEPSILEFFTPLETSLKKIIEVSEFQTRHRNMKYQFLLKKYNYIKKEASACNNANKRLNSENKMLKSMLGAAGYNQPFLTSTPMSQGGTNPLFHNTSRASSIPSNMLSFGDQEKTPRMYPGFPKRFSQYEVCSETVLPKHKPYLPLRLDSLGGMNFELKKMRNDSEDSWSELI